MSTEDSWLLGFDASTPRCVIVVGRVDAEGRHALVAHDDRDEGANQVSATLVARLAAVLRRAGVEPDELVAVACGCGPGTFTGTRVAVATAKGLCLGLDRPLLPVSTLAVIALSAEHTGWVLPLLDARRGEVYGGLVETTYRADAPSRARMVGKQRCAAAADIASEAVEAAAGSPILVAGTGVEPYRDTLPEALRATARPSSGPTAPGLWAAVVAAHASGAAVDPANAAAVYLRKSYAELGVNKPKRPFVRSPFV